MEAGRALEQLETKLSALNIEREEEKERLETRLQILEADLTDSRISPIKLPAEEDEDKTETNADKDVEDRVLASNPADDDEKLLREVSHTSSFVGSHFTVSSLNQAGRRRDGPRIEEAYVFGAPSVVVVV